MFRTRSKSTSSPVDVRPGGSEGSILIARAYRALPLLLSAGWPFLFFWQAATGLGMFYFGDIARFFYPTRLLYAQALASGRIGLWIPEILMGFPLFAEMQTGGVYPLHIALYRLLPIDLAINYDILLHLALLGSGLYLFARSRGTSGMGSLITALGFSAGGFGVGRITHMSVLSVVAWLPWSLYLYNRWLRGHSLRDWVLLTLAFAMMFVAGHPQFILLNALTFGFYAIAETLAEWRRPTRRARDRVPLLVPFAAAVLAAVIAAVQLWPTAELAGASARAGGVTEAFFTEFSYHPYFLALFFNPFLLGNPYPNLSVEVIGYVGAFPLLLAGAAVLLRRKDRSVWLWLILAALCFFLALGGSNPLYREMRFVPLLNLFRVPARFLIPILLSVAMLAGMGFDALAERAARSGSPRMAGTLAFILGAGVLLVLLATPVVGVDGWLSAWRVLPFLFWGAAGAVAYISARGRMNLGVFRIAAVGITLIDLAAFGAVYAQSFNAIAPRADIFRQPRVLPSLFLADGARTRTSEWMFPWVPEMRESLFPNLNAAFRIQSAQGYTPLIPRRTQTVFENLSPVMLNLLGVRYFLVPQVLPVNAESEAADVDDPFMIHPVGRTLEFQATPATGIEVESSLAQSVDLRDGDPVADIVVTTAEGKTLRVPLLAGRDTAEWAYERSDVRGVVKHSEAPIASTFAARSAFPVQEHVGHTFRGNLQFSQTPVPVVNLTIEPRVPAGHLFIQKLALTEGESRVDIGTLVKAGNHRLVYRSEDVAVFENLDYAPRAFITHNAVRVQSDEEALARLAAKDYSGELLLADGLDSASDVGQQTDESTQITLYQPEHVIVRASAQLDGYLVLADAWDPGWVAMLDGRSVPIHRADVVLRAIELPAGEHTVEFYYRPVSFYGGLIISGVGIAILVLVVLAAWLIQNSRRSTPPVI